MEMTRNEMSATYQYLKKAEREEWAKLQEMKSRPKWSKAHTESIKDQQSKWFGLHERMTDLERELFRS